MVRELRPHGTVAAYNRHRAHGESPCDKCKAAMAASRVESRRKKKEREAIQAYEAEFVSPVAVDEEKVLLETLAKLRAHQDVASAREAASIAKGIRDTLVALRGVRESKQEKERAVSVIDQISQRRRLRAQGGATGSD